ncbi:hypothetical protein EJB05_29332, partial [Eragrostis curvula]
MKETEPNQTKPINEQLGTPMPTRVLLGSSTRRSLRHPPRLRRPARRVTGAASPSPSEQNGKGNPTVHLATPHPSSATETDPTQRRVSRPTAPRVVAACSAPASNFEGEMRVRDNQKDIDLRNDCILPEETSICSVSKEGLTLGQAVIFCHPLGPTYPSIMAEELDDVIAVFNKKVNGVI